MKGEQNKKRYWYCTVATCASIKMCRNIRLSYQYKIGVSVFHGMQKCHYEVLGIPIDANDGLIRKSYHKLALVHHPDKGGSTDDFRLIQEAYETLSDPAERRWYDDHRQSILSGKGSAGGRNNTTASEPGVECIFIYDVTPYHMGNCYKGFGDGVSGFYQTYTNVFQEIILGEKKGWINDGNIDETLFPLRHLPIDFGTSTSQYSDVSSFYNGWEQFTSCLSFAWMDAYDIQSGESRWERRRIDEENNKLRRIAKRARNDDIISLVAFIKKRDPRVRAAREKAEAQKIEQENRRLAEIERKRVETMAAKEAWVEEKEKAMKQYELDDLNAGRIRLADLDDSEEEEGEDGRNKKGKKSKRKKKGRDSKKTKEIIPTDDDYYNSNVDESELPNDASVHLDKDGNINQEEAKIDLGNNQPTENHITNTHTSDDYDQSDPDVDVWRCEVCRKDFKSEKQLDNHVQSKKHKEAVKKMATMMRQQMESD